MDGYIGEIRAFGFSYNPEYWLPCTGQQVSIQSYQALFAIIGDKYGSTDYRTYFTLPNLQGVSLLGATIGGSQAYVGVTGGTEIVGLTINQMPSHTHIINGDRRLSSEASLATNIPGPTVFLSNPLAQSGTTEQSLYAYSDVLPTTDTPNYSLLNTNGQSSPHENRMPYVAMQYCICCTGEFPIHS